MKTLSELKKEFKKVSCPEFPFFGAHYPDAGCVDGVLHDLDKCDENGNLYVMSEYNPCPFCRTSEWLKIQRDNEVPRKEALEWLEKTFNRYSGIEISNEK